MHPIPTISGKNIIEITIRTFQFIIIKLLSFSFCLLQTSLPCMIQKRFQAPKAHLRYNVLALLISLFQWSHSHWHSYKSWPSWKALLYPLFLSILLHSNTCHIWQSRGGHIRGMTTTNMIYKLVWTMFQQTRYMIAFIRWVDFYFFNTMRTIRLRFLWCC